MQLPGQVAREHGDDGGHARPDVGRSFPDRARHVGPAGRRGVARPGVGQAAREDCASTSRSCAPRSRRERLEHHGVHYDIPVQRRYRARQAAEADDAAAARRRSRSTSRRSRRGRSSWRSRSPTAGCRSSGRPSRRAPCSRSTLARDGFEVAPCVPAVLTDDVESGRAALKEYYSFYIGGMGARAKNFYNDLFARYGYEAEAREIQELFLGRQAARGGGEGAGRVRRRGCARRDEGADRRPARSVARVGRDDAARLDARRGDAAWGRRGRS